MVIKGHKARLVVKYCIYIIQCTVPTVLDYYITVSGFGENYWPVFVGMGVIALLGLLTFYRRKTSTESQDEDNISTM